MTSWNSRLSFAAILLVAVLIFETSLNAQLAKESSDQKSVGQETDAKVAHDRSSASTKIAKRRSRHKRSPNSPRRQKLNGFKTHEGVQATLWVQSSIEYQMACKQTYALATLRLARNLADKSFTAALEQKGDFSKLPPAVILDIDETSLDNSPFQARMVKNDGVFVPEEWTEWVNEAKASAVPGAAEFIKTAKRLGVEIVFVTNRSADTEAQTIKNLKDVFGIHFDKDLIHCKNERPEWGSNKNSRRQFVCESFRVIGLIGDDYNDFAWIGKPSPKDRKEIGVQFEKQWGNAWFLLPNPLYGNWDKALYDYDFEKSRKDVLKLKYQHLETKE